MSADLEALIAGTPVLGDASEIASLAVSSGATVKSIQRMLGHASAAMTLDVYSGLFADDLDAVTERLDTAAREALEDRSDSVRTSVEIRPLPTTASGF